MFCRGLYNPRGNLPDPVPHILQERSAELISFSIVCGAKPGKIVNKGELYIHVESKPSGSKKVKSGLRPDPGMVSVWRN